MKLDHPHGGAGDPGELEHRDPGGERVADEGRPQVVDPRRGLDARSLDRRSPLAAAEVVEVQQSAGRSREEARGIEPRRERVESFERLEPVELALEVGVAGALAGLLRAGPCLRFESSMEPRTGPCHAPRLALPPPGGDFWRGSLCLDQ